MVRALTSVLDIWFFKEVWDTMLRCRSLEPTSSHITADIEVFGNVQLMIVFKGCVVPECWLRYGHRLQAHNCGQVLKWKVTNRQRKHLLMMGPMHPDAQGTLNILHWLNQVEELAFDEIEEELIIE